MNNLVTKIGQKKPLKETTKYEERLALPPFTIWLPAFLALYHLSSASEHFLGNSKLQRPFPFPQNPVSNPSASLLSPSELSRTRRFRFTRWLASATPPRGESIRHSSSFPLLSMSLSVHSAKSKLTESKLIWTTVIVSEQALIAAKASLMLRCRVPNTLFECSSQFSPRVRDGCRCAERERERERENRDEVKGEEGSKVMEGVMCCRGKLRGHRGVCDRGTERKRGR